MSHFVVLAFGENVDRMLEPYYEGIEVDEYYSGDVSEEEKDDFIEYHKEFLEKEGRPLQNGLSKEEEMETLYKEFGMDWNGDNWRLEDGTWVRYSTYNPDSKWDWYQPYGRFSDFFKLKPNAEFKNSLTISDIDFIGKIEENKKQAEKDWKDVNRIFNEANTGNFKSWKEIFEMKNLTIDEQRDLYNNQPEIIAYKEYLGEDDFIAFYEKLEDCLVSKEEFVDTRIYSGVVPYAYVSEETGWREKGEMGWFGMSNDKYSDKEWFKEFMEFITSLPLETPVSIIDCHI